MSKMKSTPPTQKKKRANLFDTADLSNLELPDNEPLSVEVVSSYRTLARAVILRAIEDTGNEDDLIARTAIRFCTGTEQQDVEDRQFWTGWIGMDDSTLARIVNLKMEWRKAAGNSQAKPRRNAPLAASFPMGEAHPLRRSRPIQPEGLSYGA